MERFKHFCIVHCAEFFKITTGFIMILTSAAMVYDKHVDNNALPNFFELSQHDWYLWAVSLGVVGVLNIAFTFLADYFKYRIFADLMLQFSGLALLIVGWAFIVEYPPLHRLMIFYPTWGMGMVIAGRYMGKRSRQRLHDCRQRYTKCRKG